MVWVVLVLFSEVPYEKKGKKIKEETKKKTEKQSKYFDVGF